MDDDTPNTQAKPVPATVILVPDRWFHLGEGCAELLIKRIDMAAIDFYPEKA